MFVPTAAENISKAAPWAVYGAVLILFVFVMPGGVARVLRRRQGRRDRASTSGPAGPGDLRQRAAPRVE